MSKNCLVTKLKGSVDNENLDYLGIGFAMVYASSVETDTIMNVVFAKNCEVEFIGAESSDITLNAFDASFSEHISKDGNKLTFTLGSGESSYSSAQHGRIQLAYGKNYTIKYNKYYLSMYLPNDNQGYLVLDTKYVKWTQAGAYGYLGAYGNVYKGDIGELVDGSNKNSSYIFLNSMNDNNNQLTGDISELNRITGATNIELSFEKQVTGTIDELAAHPNVANITDLRVFNSGSVSGSLVTALSPMKSLVKFNGENNARFTGTLENIAIAQVAGENGRRSGTLTIEGYMINVTPNPSTCANRKYIITFKDTAPYYEITQ